VTWLAVAVAVAERLTSVLRRQMGMVEDDENHKVVNRQLYLENSNYFDPKTTTTVKCHPSKQTIGSKAGDSYQS
jgi:hypothetical protein